MAIDTKRTAFTLTSDQVQGWIKDKLSDPAWVADMKARSDKADARLREKGLLPK